ncbi:S-layer homology domain-containing protein [Pseudoflavonifractor sp. 524-17]|uniref:S-layer homology domain-containing protein n=1 Tax=Pseudoflavonifractor sp. 524-17 TaxID=2304577 RepID=UPI00137B251F|nr:S-layer homology domain-containing protein [Pseudoflavonifractor sp. 524-17]
MKLKRIVSALLAAAVLAGLLILPAGAAADGAGFNDISDPEIAEAAEILRLLGVVSGTGGGFNPGGILTRAEFCKLAVDVMDKGALEPAQRGRTIFLDVGPKHWARGYINLASSLTTSGDMVGTGSSSDGEQAADRLIMGVGNGTFQPDRPITYGEAVAILVRILGYNTSDISAGSAWYDGYLAVARQNGLADGLSLDGGSHLTRGQAALLFRNLLFTDLKDSDQCYLVAKLGGKLTGDTLVLDISTNASSGSNTVTVANGTAVLTPKTNRASLSSQLRGTRGEMVQDRDGNFLTLRPSSTDTLRRVSVSGKVDGNYITVSGGEQITIPHTTTVWRNGEATTFDKVWTYLYSGTPLVLCYSGAGKLDYVYLSSASEASEDVMVARTKPNGTSNPFVALTKGDPDYQIYKNGVPATVADLRQYDVATYDRGAKILYVSDTRLTGMYENAYPNPTAPATITMLGQEFTVLPGAVSDLSAFRPGKTVTLLLTADGRVAGALDTTVARSTTVGVVTACTSDSAKVEPLLDIYNAKGERIVFEGNPGLSAANAERMVGQLVTISSGMEGRINLSRLSGRGASGPMSVAGRTVNGVSLAENVRLFERVGTGQPKEIEYSQITRETVPASKILYVGKDYAGKINLLIFDDVTGDQYSYGFARFVPAQETTGMEYSNATITVENGGSSDTLICGTTFHNREAIGIAASLETMDGSHKLAGSVTLQSASNVKREAYDPDTKTMVVNGITFPVSEAVWCYNRTTGHWFSAGLAGLEEARSYSNTMTVYYDKSPESGGKIRIVTVS